MVIGGSVNVSAVALHPNDAVPDSPTSFCNPLLGNEKLPEKVMPLGVCTSNVAVPVAEPSVNVIVEPLFVKVPFALPLSVIFPVNVPDGVVKVASSSRFVLRVHVPSVPNVSV